MDVADRSAWGVEFRSFPRGACGDTSLMLGQFLFDQGCGTFDYVSGISNVGSHAWIEQDGLIVDITGDQFPEFGERVYVSRDRAWHARFLVDTRVPACIDVFGPDAAWNLRRVYELICNRMAA